MEPTIRRQRELKVIGLGTRFVSILAPDAGDATVVPRLWDALMQRVQEIPGAHEYSSVGLCMALPEHSEKAHPRELYYVAGIEVDRLDDIPEGMLGHVVPEANYAVFTHRGPISRLAETYHHIYDTWIPSSDRELDQSDHPTVEWYDERFDPASETSEMEIWIPLESA